MSIWKTMLPIEAIRNNNISLTNCPFSLSPFIGGTNESERPKNDLVVYFDKSHTAKMWVYGKGSASSAKNILTNNGRNDVKRFFDLNGIDGTSPTEIEIEEVAIGELIIRKA